MRVLFVTSECYPYVKTGGLGDVSAALPVALRQQGADVRLLLPAYPDLLRQVVVERSVWSLPRLPGLDEASPGRLLAGRTAEGVPVYLIDAPTLYAREGNPYLDASGRDWADNAARFAALGRVAALVSGHGDGAGWWPDVVHGHDWQAGLAPAYLVHSGQPRPATVMTIHNLAFQGLFPSTLLPELELPEESFDMHGLEFHGRIGFLKAGLFYADRLTTVSPTYAEEIQGPAFGFGLEGLLRTRAAELTGILNGVDYRHWDPAHDPLIGCRYDSADAAGKARCKAELQEVFGLEPRPGAPLFAVVSRLTDQKGIDLVVQALPRLVHLGGQLAVLGTGSRELEAAIKRAADDYRGTVGVRLAYDEDLSHKVQAGADVLLVPSRFEPCGLTQMYALRYGTLPLVTQVGGLADTVVDTTERTLADGTATGFVFADVSVTGMMRTLERAAALWKRPDLWEGVRRTAMGRDFGWDRSARRYLSLYGELLAGSARRADMLDADRLAAQ
ncbi:MAG TPA: glycogen synthase GlgA [Azospirillaceae bacterium]|nr:glycogen synthase GlgA [Azospirillaceae bacterium]